MLDRALLALERPGRIWAAALSAVALVALSLWRAPLGRYPTYLGKYYAELATDPFHPAADNPVGHRLLAPLLSWSLGLRGELLLVTNLLIVLTLLAAVYLWFRGRDDSPALSLTGTSVLALSMVTLTTLHYGGYTDSLTYLLVFAAYWMRARLWLSCALFLLALTNHEAAVFLAPWWFVILAQAQRPETHGARRAAIAVVLTLGVFVAFRLALERLHPSVSYRMGFYLAPLRDGPLHWFRESTPHRGLGIVQAFNLYWLIPLAAAARMVSRRGWRDAAVLLLPIPCALAQLFIAYDVTRLATLSFMSVLLGAEYLLRTNGWQARYWIVPLSIANFLIPQLNIAMGIVDHMGRR